MTLNTTPFSQRIMKSLCEKGQFPMLSPSLPACRREHRSQLLEGATVPHTQVLKALHVEADSAANHGHCYLHIIRSATEQSTQQECSQSTQRYPYATHEVKHPQSIEHTSHIGALLFYLYVFLLDLPTTLFW